MKKRRLVWIAAVLVLLLGAGYGVLWLTGPGHRINARSFERIQKGITEEEVKEILGVPAGDYSTESALESSFGGIGQYGILKRWISDDAGINIYFDERGLVNRKLHWHVIRLEESMWAKLRRWLRIN